MRIAATVAVVLVAAGCKPSERCSSAISCAKGSYQACTNGSACSYKTSDGQAFACASCADCMGAVSSTLSWCGGVGGVGGSDGGALAETPACMDYLTCVATTAPAQLAALSATYGPGGSCWQTRATAASCDEVCQAALASSSCGGTSGGGGSGGGDAGGGGGVIVSGPDMSVPTYLKTTVATMRANSPGYYEIDGAIAIAVTSSTGTARLLFQDAAAGQFSAMMGKGTLLTNIAVGSTLIVQGQYI
ncbi:MAG TPA: hypothetical protein VIA18_03085, partial [Polyangia bacterium]|nr:hypothetical protein [Polyangia bacterium]